MATDDQLEGPDLSAIAARVEATRGIIDQHGVLQCERDRLLLWDEIIRLRKMVNWLSDKVQVQAELLARKAAKIQDALKEGSPCPPT